MSSDFIDREIDEAHYQIKQGNFEAAVSQLKDIKLRVHEPKVVEVIKNFENEHDSKLEERLKKIDGENSDPLRKQSDAIDQVAKYARSYLSFYDKLRKDYEIY